jgi:YVTN family beta-propeller protein
VGGSTAARPRRREYDLGVIARFAAAALAAAILVVALAASASAAPRGTRDVLVIGNNWDGTADVVDPHSFERLTRLDIIPDIDERLAEIFADPVRTGFFVGINILIGEGHHQYVDDAFTSNDGRFLYVSRPSLADVVGIDLGTRRIVWRTPIEGQRADHMAISPDGTRVLVSASTARKVHAIDTASGRIVGGFESGDQPHENNYSRDGRRIFHASIGTVYTPTDAPALDFTKGDRYLQVVDARTYQVLKRVEVGKVLAAHGHTGYSSAVRPMALSPDERVAYLQLSFFHGFVEWDIEQSRPLRIATLPLSDASRNLAREQYLLDSAHHGIAMNPQGTKLCVAGTMSDYGAIVRRSDFGYKLFNVGRKPYWSTNSGDGRYCFVSASGDDQVTVIDYASERIVARIPVGDHPQRMRMGVMRSSYLPPSPDRVRPRLSRLKVVRMRRGRRGLRLRLSEDARLQVVVQRRRGRRWARVRTVRRRGRLGTNTVPLGALRRGARYRLTVSARDGGRNLSRRARLGYRAR